MTGCALNIRQFASPELLADKLADDVADQLSNAIAGRGSAVLAVSGGSTPARFFDCLSRRQIDWSRVIVMLVDDRYVEVDSDRSNAGLVRKRLLRNAAARARFLPMHADTGASVENAASAAARILGPHLPIDACILGMGPDGHTASWFPGGDNLERALQADQPQLVLAMHAENAVEPRLTLTLPAILSARFLALHVEGEEKHRVLCEAARTGKAGKLPIATLLEHAGERLGVYWTA